MKLAAVKKGDISERPNTYRRFGSADVYEIGWIKRYGRIVPVAFTDSMLDDAEALAAKNKEDIPPLKRGWFDWLNFFE